MDVKVDCYAGYRGEETPKRFESDGRRVEVVEVIDRWFGPDHRYFKVRGDDRALYLLRHDERADRWELKMLERARRDPPGEPRDSGRDTARAPEGRRR